MRLAVLSTGDAERRVLQHRVLAYIDGVCIHAAQHSEDGGQQ